MKITQCDVCKKTISPEIKNIQIMTSDFCSGYFEICPDCNKPVIEFLKNKKLIQNDKKNGRE